MPRSNRGYILSESDAGRLRDMNDAVGNITGGRYVGRRTRRGGAGGGDTYNGFFKVTAAESGIENNVDISAGKVINGTTVTDVPIEEDLDVENMLYIALEVWYTGSWQVDFIAETSYPDQSKKGDDYVWRVLIASREDADSSWDRQACGELHNPRAVPA